MKKNGPKSFAELYRALTDISFKKYGFINCKLITEWPHIVGQQIASICTPEKIVFPPDSTSFGVLYLVITNAAFSLEVQSCEYRIIERISAYFGYKAVSSIRISVEPARCQHASDPQAALEVPTLTEALIAIEDNIQDEELRNALLSLYLAIAKE